MKLKVLLRAGVILIRIANMLLTEMSLDSKYNRMEEFNKLFITFKSLKTKQKNRNTTQNGAIYEKCRRALQQLL